MLSTKSLFEDLGFSINIKKSVMIPSRQIIYLGFLWNTENMTISLPSEKIDKILSTCHNILEKNLVGQFVAAFPAILLGRFYYRNLENQKIESLRNFNSFDAKISLADDSKEEIIWWINNIREMNGCPIKKGPIFKTIFSDACTSGWGAWCESQLVHGKWDISDMTEHINFLELKAIWLALQAFGSKFNNVHIAIKSDNSTAVAYINNLGGIKSSKLNSLSKQIWLWCFSRNIDLSAFHVSGKDNSDADFLSRIDQAKNSTEWSLEKDVFQSLAINFELGIDLFASSKNAQLAKYVSWGPDPEAWANNAFSIDWSLIQCNIYIFPPFSLIDRILEKIQRERPSVGILLIAPFWPTQAWFPTLTRLTKLQPLRLPYTKSLVTSTINREPHPLWKKLHLTAWWI